MDKEFIDLRSNMYVIEQALRVINSIKTLPGKYIKIKDIEWYIDDIDLRFHNFIFELTRIDENGMELRTEIESKDLLELLK